MSNPVWRVTTAMLLLGLGASCTAVEDAQEGVDEQAITNATTTSAFPAVAQLIINNHSWCTATLIGPQALLTAAHCVHYTHATIGVWYHAVWYEADRWTWHSDYDPNVVGAVGLEGNTDLAVVHLAQAVTGVRPMRLADVAPASGQPFTVVGYGESYSGEGTFRTKRRASATVGTVYSDWFAGSGDSSPCHADSGGPAIAKNGTIVGVFARMWNDCRGGVDGFSYVTVAPLREWIATYE